MTLTIMSDEVCHRASLPAADTTYLQELIRDSGEPVQLMLYTSKRGNHCEGNTGMVQFRTRSPSSRICWASPTCSSRLHAGCQRAGLACRFCKVNLVCVSIKPQHIMLTAMHTLASALHGGQYDFHAAMSEVGPWQMQGPPAAHLAMHFHLVQDEPRLRAAEVALDVGENVQADCAGGDVGGRHREAAEVRDGPAQCAL